MQTLREDMRKWYDRHFQFVNGLAALLLTIALTVWSERYHGKTTIYSLLLGNRAYIYAALVSLYGSLLGFSITTVSIVAGFVSHDRLQLLRDSTVYDSFWRVFQSAITSLAVGTIMAITALVFDRDLHPRIAIFYMCFGVTVWCAFRIQASISLLGKMIAILTAPPKTRSGVDQ